MVPHCFAKLYELRAWCSTYSITIHAVLASEASAHSDIFCCFFFGEYFDFFNFTKHVIDFMVNDDAMLSHYQDGDYVAGIKRFGDKIDSLVGYDCIAQVTDGRILMRSLQRGPRDHSFNLVVTNLQTKAKNAVIYDIELASAAPIIWHRRREPIS
jgi:hypothetical protein